MFDIIQLMLINCLVIVGIHKTTDEGMVFQKVGDWITTKVGEYWSKPLIGCIPCMGSVHGIWFYLFFVDSSLWFLPVYIFALCGLNTLAVKVIYQ